MARGWAKAPDEERPKAMIFMDLDRARAEALAAEVDGETRDSLPALRDASDVLLLAVKPVALDDVAQELQGKARAIISVMAATTLGRLGEVFPGVPTVRVMPNQPAEVRRGVLCYAVDDGIDATLAGQLVRLLSGVGETVPVAEPLMEAAMAVMSCSPAYVALFAEALANAGAADGLDPETALDLVASTLEGTAELLRTKDPAAIRAAVAPPGGATEAGLKALDEGGFEAAIDAAVKASLERFR
jgi:pyrroline-5-carboxylate reductase